ncbi:MAG: hypothetical protein HIU82_09645 [Proteobacteria bacterium]|nr:hypothetical protein [Pseudomonadota bacterium]
MPEDPEPERSLRATWLGVVVILVLLVVGIFLVGRIGRMVAIQDCVAQGRTNCAPIAASPRG